MQSEAVRQTVAQWREQQRARAWRYLDQRELGSGNEHEDARACGMTVQEARELMAWFEHDAERRRLLGAQIDAFEERAA